jgi:integrase
MGRKPTRWTNLPKGMRARPRGRKIHYYLDTGETPRKEIALGCDYLLAVKRWAELTEAPKPAGPEGSFPYVVERYWRDVVPTKAPRTQQDNEKERAWLLRYFGDPPAPLAEVKPAHISKFLKWRVAEARKAAIARGEQPGPKYGEVRANREKALFSHIWNYARAEGLTDLPNPCLGVKGYAEEGRDASIDEATMQAVLRHADEPTRLAIRLADATGQRPSDVLRMNERDIRDGVLHVKQGKTRAKLRIVVEGELANVIDACREYKAARPKAKVSPMALLVNKKGAALTYAMLQDRFTDARNAAGVELDDFQFRDLRAKTATELDEAGGTRAAQAVLGHTTESMTEKYIRHKVGRKVRVSK